MNLGGSGHSWSIASIGVCGCLVSSSTRLSLVATTRWKGWTGWGEMAEMTALSGRTSLGWVSNGLNKS